MLYAQFSLILLRRNCPVETRKLPISCAIYMLLNKNALSLRAVQLKNVVSLCHISVRYSIIHSLTTLHKERVGLATSN